MSECIFTSVEKLSWRRYSVYHSPMKIPEVKNTPKQSINKVKKDGPTATVKFAEHLDDLSKSTPETTISSDSILVTGVNSVLAVQEVSEEPERGARKQLTGWGEDILDCLDEIRHGLLIGAIPKDRLSNLARTLKERRANVSDPRLIEIIYEIEIRAEVELAKLAKITQKYP